VMTTKTPLNKSLLLSSQDIRALPKVELHLHLDCCLSFAAVEQLKPGITRMEYERDFIAPDKCRDLADFLKVIDAGLDLLQTKAALELAVADLFNQLVADNVIYAEIRFAPLLHLKNGLTPHAVVSSVEKALERAIKRTGIQARLILCSLRHFTQQQSLETVMLTEQFQTGYVAAFDLAADEAGFPIDAHIAAFEYARRNRIPCTAHAGEARGPESVRETLDKLTPTRIGHGVRSIEDPELVKLLVRNRVHLEICPSCNVQIAVYDEYKDHPVQRLYKAGVPISINTDTRTITNISLSQEYERLHQVFGWGRDHFLMCNRNAVAAAFITDRLKLQLSGKLVGSRHD